MQIYGKAAEGSATSLPFQRPTITVSTCIAARPVGMRGSYLRAISALYQISYPCMKIRETETTHARCGWASAALGIATDYSGALSYTVSSVYDSSSVQ